MGVTSKVTPFIIVNGKIIKGVFTLNVKLFTHTDLDGMGSVILAKHAFRNVDVAYCNYDTINSEVMEFLEDDGLNAYDMVFITDISVNEEVAKELDFYSCYEKVVLLDHHKTSEWVNAYDWGLSIEEANGMHTCGTQLFYDYLLENKWIKGTKKMAKFVETVRRWDVYDWKAFNDITAYELNVLFCTLGRKAFLNRFSKNVSVEFTEYEKNILNLERKRYEEKLAVKRKSMVEKVLDAESNGLERYNMGVVFCNTCISAIGNDLADENEHLDFIMLISPDRKSLSFRARQDSKVDLSKVAKLFGGGGHKFSSGATISEEKFNNVIDAILSL